MTKASSVDRNFRELLARQQIHDALLRYCRGVDRLDPDIIQSAYHPGARDNHGSFDGPVDKFIEWVMSNHAGGKVLNSVHHLGNSLITFEDEKIAHGETYVSVNHRRLIDGELFDLISHGRFIDRFEERNDEWKIVDRLVVVDWDRLDRVDRQWGGPLTEKLENAQRSREDASYRALKPGFEKSR